MKARAAVAALTAAAALGAAAASGRQEPQPALVVLVVVDQLRPDYLERFAPGLSGGLAWLLREGAVFTHAFQDHGVTETAPGHSTLLSGRHPSSTGITRNEEGVPDPGSPLVEAAGDGASPFRFRGTALADWMRAAHPASRALSVSRKDRGAILPVGRSREQVYWYANGRFTTSRWYADSLPGWVGGFNDQVAAWQARAVVWDLLLPASAYPEPDDAPWENGGRDITFPHRMGSGAGGLPLASLPWIDSLIMALALRGVRSLDLGAGQAPDLLVVSLSGLDATGHSFGPYSREVHDHVLRLDRWLGVFLDSLALLRGADRLLVALAADHGVESFPEWSWAQGRRDAGWVNVDTLLRRHRAALTERLGPGRWVGWRSSGLVALDRPGLALRGVDVDSLADALRRDLLRVPGVQRVDTRRTLVRVDTSRDATGRRWRHALPDSSAGEVMITLRPGWLFGRAGSDAGHGQPADAAAHVPIVLWGSGVRQGRFSRRASTVDIGPTLAHILGVTPLERVDGRVLWEALTRSGSGP